MKIGVNDLINIFITSTVDGDNQKVFRVSSTQNMIVNELALFKKATKERKGKGNNSLTDYCC